MSKENQQIHTQKDFNDLLNLIQKTRQKAYSHINTALILLYWQIGKHISERVASATWGKSVVTELAKFISHNDPEIKGFSDKNLWRMKQFYETYHENKKLSLLVKDLPWSHNLAIFSRCKTDEEREFYLKISIQEKYSFRELDRQISAGYFERTMLSNVKLSTALRVLPHNLTKTFKDSYVLEFLGLPDSHSESDLKKALVNNMKTFILELGKDFIFVGEEYRLQVGNQDFFIDLLFFHRGLCALVAFELKVGKFKPDYLGQLNFYLEALDRDVKKTHENPSIGVLLCRDKDEEVVEYALSRNLVAEYQLQLPDKKLIQAKLHELLANEPWTDEEEEKL